MTFIKKLLQLHKKKFTYFTTPSHAQAAPYKSVLGEKYFKVDFSEIDALDNLNNPQSCILELENRLKDIYSSSFTHILTNGSTQGMLALMLAVLNAGDKVIVAANCHISVHHGLILTGAIPIWIYPDYDTEFGIYKGICPEHVKQIIADNPDAKCLIITNPTYDGIMSDIEKIADICRQNNIILISDEAHGGLWNFDKVIGVPSILCGADASVQSLHKTCGGINPTALLHLSKNSKISQEKLMDAIRLISTTSPSFAAIANVEETVNFLTSKNGAKLIDNLLKNIFNVHSHIKKLKNIKIYLDNNDITKILIATKNITSEEASDILYDKFKIECEIAHKHALTFLCGAGTTKNKLNKLLKGLQYIDKIEPESSSPSENTIIPPQRIMKIPPRQAYYSDTETAELKYAIGKISADILISYPPGIPVITYGEVITNEHLNFLSEDTKIRIVK